MLLTLCWCAVRCVCVVVQWAEEFLLDLRRSRKREDMLYVSWGFGAGYRVLGMDQHFRYSQPPAWCVRHTDCLHDVCLSMCVYV